MQKTAFSTGEEEEEWTACERSALLAEIKRLKAETHQKESEIAVLKQEVATVTTRLQAKQDDTASVERFKASISRHAAIRLAFHERMQFILAFIATLRALFTSDYYHPTVGGSFMRQIFEALFGDAQQGYADCRGRDLDIILCPDCCENPSKQTRQKIASDFKRFAQSLDACVWISRYASPDKLAQDKLALPKFGEFVLCGVTDVTVTSRSPTDSIGLQALYDVPHLRLEFKGPTGNLEVDLMSWIPSTELWKHGDFDVNAIRLSSEGITCFSENCCPDHAGNKRDFFNILTKIQHKEAACKLDLEKLHDYACEPHTKSRLNYFNQLTFFVTSRWRKMAEIGYTMVSGNHTVPLIQIENKDRCALTGTAAPYPTVALTCSQCDCQRKLSIQAFADCTHRLKYNCPSCQQDDERFQFSHVAATSPPVWLPMIPSCGKLVNPDEDMEQKSERCCVMSTEATEKLLGVVQRRIESYGGLRGKPTPPISRARECIFDS